MMISQEIWDEMILITRAYIFHGQLTLSNLVQGFLDFLQQPLTLLHYLFEFQGWIFIFFLQSPQTGNLQVEQQSQSWIKMNRFTVKKYIILRK